MRAIRFAVALCLMGGAGFADLSYIEQPRDSAGRGDATRTLSEMMERYNVPGISLAIIRDFEVAEATCFGVANVDTDEPVTPQTRFQAASISKPIAALAVLRAVEEGKIDLDADINTILTSWQLPENEFTARVKVTPAMLLSHTGGTTISGFPGYNPAETIPTPVQILNGAGNTAAVVVDKEPGSGWRYSGGGTTIMQVALSDVYETNFPEILMVNVLEPIGMMNSCYCQPPPAEVAKLCANGHDRNGKRLEGNWIVHPELAAAGLWTTPTDLCKAAIEVQHALRGEEGRILRPEMAKRMVAPPEIGSYGLGFSLSKKGGEEYRYFEHGGSNQGFKCHLSAHLFDGYGAVVMSNGDVGIRVVTEVLKRIAAHEQWAGRW